MAVTYLEWPFGFQRQFAEPLDKDQVFATSASRLAFITNARRYPGQLLADTEYNRAYMVNKDGNGYVPLAPLVLGEVRLHSGISAPKGWAFCDGASLQIADNTPLYAVLGTTYGGDGVTTFSLPDLESVQPHPSVSYIICTEGILPSS